MHTGVPEFKLEEIIERRLTPTVEKYIEEEVSSCFRREDDPDCYDACLHALRCEWLQNPPDYEGGLEIAKRRTSDFPYIFSLGFAAGRKACNAEG